MIHRIIVMVCAWWAVTAWAAERGSVTVVGQGEASSPPEFARLQLVVTSLCYDTARDAKDANAILAQSLLGILRTFAHDPRSSVIATGGPNLRQTEVIPDGDRVKILCQMKWRATNTLTLETPLLADLTDLQDQLLAAIDEVASQGADPDQVAQSYAELGQPLFLVYDETLANLRTQAQSHAFADAKMQFRAFAASCPLEDVRLVKIKPPRQEDILYRHDTRARAEAPATPLIPDEITVAANWEFEWSFLANQECVTKRRLGMTP